MTLPYAIIVKYTVLTPRPPPHHNDYYIIMLFYKGMLYCSIRVHDDSHRI